MAKPYHPCYTTVNPAGEARKYTTERIFCRKVTLTYDWLPPHTQVEGWLRRVPYRLEGGDTEGSWIVKYFEFRAGIAPLPQLGSIGDLWISWDAGDPSVWFKVEEIEWERWGGCASSVREQINARHPFLDGAFLWFSPRDYFFVGKLPDSKLSLKWDRSARIRRIAPTTRIIDPDSDTPPKKVPVNPVNLPGMRTIIRTLCPNMLQPRPAPPMTTPMTMPVATSGDGGGDGAVASSSRVRLEDLRRRYPTEEINIGDQEEIDWDWWGSSDGEADNERTQVESSQPQLTTLTPTPPLTAPPRNSRYHPYQFTPPPTTPYSKFKPPARYAKGTLSQNPSPNNPSNTPVSTFPSTSSTVVNTMTPTPRLASEPINLVFTNDKETTGPQEPRIILNQKPQAHKPSRWTLEGIAEILVEDGHVQSGVWALLPSEICNSGDDLAADLSIPILDLGTQTVEKIQRLLRQDGFVQTGILVLKMDKPANDNHDGTEMEDIRAWF